MWLAPFSEPRAITITIEIGKTLKGIAEKIEIK